MAGIDVVVVADGTPADLEKTLTGLGGQPDAGRIRVVLSDPVSDDLRAVLSARADVEVLTAPAGVGAALAAGLAAPESPFVLVVRAGTVLDHHCLDQMLARGKANRSAAVVAPLILDASGNMVRGVSGRPPSARTALVARVNALTARMMGKIGARDTIPTATVSVGWASADCALVRTASLTALGVPDARLTTDFAMAEWCRRLPAGSTVLIEPLAGCVISSDRTATEAETRADLSRYATICGLRILGLAAGMGMVTPRSVDVAG